ncbi:MAG TPA: hypothetical protein VEK08_11575 [Planctomycetota bacterium]|nr:hypothetical protein [Planctomycetota bacterium]
MPSKPVLDILYFDAAKCASILQQLGEAPSQEPDFARLKRFEELAFQGGAGLDVNTLAGPGVEAPYINEKVKAVPYVRAEGWTSMEDYDRFKNMADNSNAMIEFIGRCTVNALEQSAEYQKAQQELDNVRAAAKKEVDRNKRAGMEARVKHLETRFRNMVAEQTQMNGLPDWMVAGFGLFIESFLRGRIHLRCFPFDGIPEFQLLANLKRDCFVAGSFDNLISAYGTRPTAKLTMLGFVTAAPDAKGHPFNFMSQFARPAVAQQDAKLEQAFRQFFNALEMLEGLIGFSRYPNITVYPIAVYRKLGG